MAAFLEKSVKLGSVVSVKAGSATLMISGISDEESLDFPMWLKTSKEVQGAFSVVLERFLLSKFGRATDRHGEGCFRATDFITVAKSVLDTKINGIWSLLRSR